MQWMKNYVFHWSALVEITILWLAWLYTTLMSGEESKNKEEIEYYDQYVRIAANCRLVFSLGVFFFNERFKILSYTRILTFHCVIRTVALATVIRAEQRLRTWIIPFPIVISSSIEIIYLLYLYTKKSKLFDRERWKLQPVDEEPELDDVTKMMLAKLANGWTRVQNGEMTEDDLIAHAQFLEDSIRGRFSYDDDDDDDEN